MDILCQPRPQRGKTFRVSRRWRCGRLGLLSLTLVLSLTASFPTYASLFVLQHVARSQKILSIEFKGNYKTPSFVLAKKTHLKVGEDFSEEDLTIAINRLNSMEIFQSVLANYTPTLDGYHIKIAVVEKWTLLPSIQFRSGGGTSFLQTGVFDKNLAGLGIEAGVEYQRYRGKPGFRVYTNYPDLLPFNTEIAAEYLNLNRNQIWVTPQAVIPFDSKRKGGHFELRPISSDLFYHGVIGFENTHISYPNQAQFREGYLREFYFGGGFGRVIPVSYLNEGGELGGILRAAGEPLSDYSYTRWDLKYTRFWRFGLHQIALQAELGHTTTPEIPLQYALGGFDTVRGFPDGEFRGPWKWNASFEFRPNLLDYQSLALQGVLFSDFGKIWGTRPVFNWRLDPVTSVGAGFRFIFPQFYRALIRLDFAQTLTPSRKWSIGLGGSQFF